ncbi:MAG: 2-amino-5-formylamino-6-ribosylaminopyrimidin-4(3H)-one 5'-monophosphate deformylase [Methanosphaera stadtmanae]|nr:2-amino-5-formylamino-6-ribosylaminopyrimidin-4(3H)-one 5'-monophosphate deformylase [Methanosphaera stadtmanae]
MNKINLKYSSGNVISKNVHKIGIISLGSHRENHGSALPIDTDSKIAANVALRVATDCGATYLGIFYAATEYSYVQHGHHLKKDDLIYNQIIPQLNNARQMLDLESVIIVNGHGGNNLIIDEIENIEEKTSLHIIFNNSIIENEGPHACTGELSMGKVLGITDTQKLIEHGDFTRNPEVGMVGLKLARENEPIIDREANIIEKEGFKVDEEIGKQMLTNAYNSILDDVKSLL